MSVSSAEELARKGRKLEEEENLEESVDCFSQALDVISSVGGDDSAVASLASERARVYLKICVKIKSRPAQLSESHALFGFDPLQIAERGLGDAERASKLVPSSAAYQGLRAWALYLCENYESSAKAYRSALGLDPGPTERSEYQEGLARVEALLKGKGGAVLEADDFECSLCFKLFYEPVTTSCGHTFCRSCLLRSQDYGNRCPACRTVLFVTSKAAVNVTLRNVLRKNFGAEYDRRREEETAKGVDQATGRAVVPLFVMYVVLPHQRMALNIFEPRYRLLVRRAMSGSRTFGMIGLRRRGDDILGVGCEVRIEECNCLPDGRFQIEVVGTRRFRVSRCEEQDGYRLAHAEYIRDDGEEDANANFALAREVDEKMEVLLDQMRGRGGGQMSAVLHALLRSTSKKPDLAGCDAEREGAVVTREEAEVWGARRSYAEDLSFWVGTFLSTIQQVDSARLVEGTSTRERLEMLKAARILE
ncbi:ATP-dependent protease LON [Chloropicon roscoffensis]|uniref:ATP-dependent protease LON n=1 Tax=Chloropicon roscoffensis TaxID=1461544 RepID=A0AAX4P0U7_9CHLO